jgi:hypothetical protein
MLKKVFEQLAQFRSYAVDTLAIMYCIGLVYWAVYSFWNSLGIVSAFDMQYFMGGFFPFIIIFSVYLILITNILPKFSANIVSLSFNLRDKFKIIFDFSFFIITTSFVSLIVIVPIKKESFYDTSIVLDHLL